MGDGVALAGTLQWMLDGGVISVAGDNGTIRGSRNKVPDEVVSRLLRQAGKLWKPGDYFWYSNGGRRFFNDTIYNSRAYVFTLNGNAFEKEAVLLPGDGDFFGTSWLDIDDDTIVIGVPNSNAAYVFVKAGGE